MPPGSRSTSPKPSRARWRIPTRTSACRCWRPSPSARREVERSYEERGLLVTEHALLDDNGDGQGSDFEDEKDHLDGELARTVFLSRGAGRTVDAELAADPELAALYEQRQELEERIAALTVLKDTMDAQQYEAELEELLVELTLTTRAIRDKEGGGDA